ncbi:MAG TPA: gluconate 2-dehydrogenase subunit 3 family protein [Opitutaceae bacterium]|nr:gluconate 2-dehydrogenase subunit 3 family protein [Opitutaceae bacterium]
MDQKETPRISRRVAVKWMLTASASLPFLRHPSWAAEEPSRAGKSPSFPEPPVPPSAVEPGKAVKAVGYGTDPDLTKTYKPGDLWPLTFTDEQRRTAAVLCDIIIPADEKSPSASKVGVPDFIDEWISAPYPNHQKDREVILPGIAWMDTASEKRFGKKFVDATEAQRVQLCDDISFVKTAKPEDLEGAKFFALFRDLTAGGFYTTPEGMQDIGYVGNRPSATFDGPPEEALRKVGLI